MEANREISVGVGCVVRRGSDILLIKRISQHGDGTYSVPGGHIDFGESLEQCAIREVLEETGLAVSDPVLLGVTNNVFPEITRQYVTVWFEAAYLSGEARLTDPKEVSEVGWFPISSLPSPLFEPFRDIAENIGFAVRDFD